MKEPDYHVSMVMSPITRNTKTNSKITNAKYNTQMNAKITKFWNYSSIWGDPCFSYLSFFQAPLHDPSKSHEIRIASTLIGKKTFDPDDCVTQISPFQSWRISHQ